MDKLHPVPVPVVLPLAVPRLQHRDTAETLIGLADDNGCDKFPSFQLEERNRRDEEAALQQTTGSYRWVVLVACFILNFTGLGVYYGSSVVLAYYTNAGILNSAEASFILSFYIGTAMFDPLTSFLAKRFGARRMILVGTSMLALGQLTSSFCTKQPRMLWMTFGLLSGWGGGICQLISMCMPGKWFPGREGFAMGIVTAGIGAGGCVFGGVTQIMLQKLGPEWTFRALAGITVLLNVPSALVVREYRARVIEERAARTEVRVIRPVLLRDASADSNTTLYAEEVEIKTPDDGSFPPPAANLYSIINAAQCALSHLFPSHLMRDTRFRYVLLSTAVLAFPIFVIPTFIPAVAGAFDYDATFATWMVVAFNVSATLSKLGQSWLCDHMHPTAVLASVLLSSAVLSGICFTVLRYTAGFTILVILAGLTTGGVYSVLTLVVTRTFSQDDALSGTAVLECLSAVGYILGPFIAGLISDSTYDYRAKGLFNGGAVWTGCMFAVSGLIMLKLWWQYRRASRAVPQVENGM